MSLEPRTVHQYHVFLASPGDVGEERRYVRKFFDEYNRHTAHIWNARFEVVDWENYSTIGVGRLDGLPADPTEAVKALEQWQTVLAFRKRMQDLNDPVFYTEYPGAAGFAEIFERDLNLWLADPARPWGAERAARLKAPGATATATLPADFDVDRYRDSLLKRFDKLNFEMLDTTGAFYSGVRLWSVFVPQSVRETHQYNPRLLEIPKEQQQRLLEAGEITAEEIKETEGQADRLRQDYFNQPLRPVLEVVDEALATGKSRTGGKLVILGDPGSGKSSLIRYLALRWTRIVEPTVRGTQPIPLVIELGSYGRWECEGQKGFVRFLEEAPVWHKWPRGLLVRLLAEPGRAVLLLDGLDEIFDVPIREAVINDMQRLSGEFPQTPILVTSRVVGYQPARLRDAEFRHYMLQDLDPGQIETFVDRWHEETFDDRAQAAPKRDRLQKAIRDSKSIAMLAGNPLLLTMMAILNRNQELPRDRAELYAQASRVLLHQWDTERALVDFPGMSAEVGLREKTDILRRVAAHMQAGPGGLQGNMIDGPALTGQIDEAFVGRIVEHLTTRTSLDEWNGEPIPEIPLAIDCLSESRNQAKLTASGRTLYKKVTAMYCIGGFAEFVEDLGVSIRNIGEKWPGISDLDAASEEVASKVKEFYAAAHDWPVFVAYVSDNRGLTEKLLELKNSGIRSGAVQVLTEKWPDETTRELLARRVLEDPSPDARGAAWLALGGMHSELGRILPTHDLDGMGPYRDPLAPIPRERIERAAKEAGIRPEDIDAQVASLSAHLGWDITLGAKESG
jgi:GTPase SAR1 family protein